MIALLLEGEPGKGEVSFWDRLIEVRSLIQQVKVYGASGYSKIPDLINELLVTEEISKIIVCFDTTANFEKWGIHLQRAKNIVVENAAIEKVVFCDFYCFEDCLLLLEQFAEWVLPERLKDSKSRSLLREYQALGSCNDVRWGEQAQYYVI